MGDFYDIRHKFDRISSEVRTLVEGRVGDYPKTIAALEKLQEYVNTLRKHPEFISMKTQDPAYYSLIDDKLLKASVGAENLSDFLKK